MSDYGSDSDESTPPPTATTPPLSTILTSAPWKKPSAFPTIASPAIVTLPKDTLVPEGHHVVTRSVMQGGVVVKKEFIVPIEDAATSLPEVFYENDLVDQDDVPVQKRVRKVYKARREEGRAKTVTVEGEVFMVSSSGRMVSAELSRLSLANTVMCVHNASPRSHLPVCLRRLDEADHVPERRGGGERRRERGGGGASRKGECCQTAKRYERNGAGIAAHRRSSPLIALRSKHVVRPV